MKEITLTELYEIMYDNMRPSGWWPGRSNWEIIWSTVLIQNANWKNASKALNLYIGLQSQCLKLSLPYLMKNWRK